MAVEQQMEMAFMEERPTVDPVSGNEVPPGSLPEEVRDDIDARLSEGEYVVPADVVRYYGVKFFEDLRGQAKMGLAEMEADGRIGGEPVDMAAASQEPIEALSEEDIMRMQEAFKTGAAKGGLIDRFEATVKNDPLVNSRMNARGYRVGFAEGGMAQSLYQDPTRVDSVIDNLMAEARKNPAMMGELAKRGITVNSTAANMQPDEMQQESKEATKAFAEGGDTSKYHSGFDPFQYGLGFSTIGMGGGAGGGAGFGDMLGQYMVDYYNPATGETMQIPHDSITNVPLKPIPAGFIRGTPPAEAPQTSARKEDDRDYTSTVKVEDDDSTNTAWQENYDYTDAAKLLKTSQDKLDSEASMLGYMSPLFGKVEQARRHAEVAANAIILEANGYSSEAKDLRDELDSYRKRNNLGLLPQEFINGDRLAKQINATQIDWGLDRDTKDVFGNPVFKTQAAFDDQMQALAPAGMNYNPSTGTYTSDGSTAGQIFDGNLIDTVSTPDGILNVYTPTETTLRPQLPGSTTTAASSSEPTQAEKDAAAATAVSNWVSATQAVQSAGNDPIARHNAIRAQSEASRAATKAIQAKTGSTGFFDRGNSDDDEDDD